MSGSNRDLHAKLRSATICAVLANDCSRDSRLTCDVQALRLLQKQATRAEVHLQGKRSVLVPGAWSSVQQQAQRDMMF